MRRLDKELSDIREIEHILSQAMVCHLALIDDQIPYIVPVHFGYLNHHLYIHSAKQGKKIDLIQRNPLVCFEVEIDHHIHDTGMPCNWSTSYKSVIGFGTASFLTNSNEKKMALDVLVKQYSPETVYEFSEKNLESVAVIDIHITSMTGKQSVVK